MFYTICLYELKLLTSVNSNLMLFYYINSQKYYLSLKNVEFTAVYEIKQFVVIAVKIAVNILLINIWTADLF